MSFILDALRKSELERQRQHGPGIAEFATARIDGRPPWALAVIGVLLALNVGVILFFLFRDSKDTQASAPAAAASAASPQSASPAVSQAPTAAHGAATEPPMSEVPGTTQQQLAAAIELPPASGASPLPAASDPTLVPAPPAATPSVSYENAAPAGDALTAQAAQGLPELSMDLHVFAAERAKRAVFINGRRYTEGATIAEGAIVEEITREGAVLTYRGHRFLLPRL